MKIRHEGMVPGLDRASARRRAEAQWPVDRAVRREDEQQQHAHHRGIVAVPFALLVGAATRRRGLPMGAAIGFVLPFIVLKVKRGRRCTRSRSSSPKGSTLSRGR